jgi:hypothetical protein
MPSGKQHIIQKVNARLRISSDSSRHKQTARLEDALYRSIQNIADILDEVPDDRVLFLDRVDVQVTLPNWNEKLMEDNIYAALRDTLQNLLHKSLKNKERDDPGSKSISENDQHKEILTFFLETGRSPWWATSQDITNAKTYLNSLSASEWMAFMQPIVQKNGIALRRYVSQWPENSVIDTLRTAANHQLGSDSLYSFLQELLSYKTKTKRSDPKMEGTKQNLIYTVLVDILGGKGEHEIVENLLYQWVRVSGFARSQQHERLNELKLFLLKKQDLPGKIRAILEKEIPEEMFDSNGDEVDVNKNVLDDHEQINSDINESESIPNAGIVLLHNYLPHLFGRLGYVEDGQFRSMEVIERAVCAIHYLGTGISEFPEEELVLAKFLCSWPFDEPVNRYLSFSDYEKEECDNLLLSVISHWKALKNTSIDGLRPSFLQRNGMLKREAFGNTLYVEELTHDILLQRLPWSFSVVKLPWMDELLSVQWRTS